MRRKMASKVSLRPTITSIVEATVACCEAVGAADWGVAADGAPAGYTSGAGLPAAGGGVSRAACQRMSTALRPAAYGATRAVNLLN